MPQILFRYAFGPFVLDPVERRLLRGGAPVALYPKAFDVLAVLVARAGNLVTKDELLAAAWPGVVVEESALSVAVSRLRAALGTEGHLFIETVPGHGYRFVAPVAVTEADAAAPLAGDSAAGPRVEDVIPLLTPSGDGVGRVAPEKPEEARAPERSPTPGAPAVSAGRRVGVLLAGAAGLVLLAFVGLAVRGDGVVGAPDPAAAAAHDPPTEALLAYRRGRTLWESRRNDVMNEALAEFKLSTTLDALFAPGYVGEAQVYAFGYRTSPAAEAALDRALALDSTLAEAWATRGFVRAFQEWDWAAAEAAFARARALNPDDVTTLQWLASLRMVQRRLPEAEAALRRALTLRPDYAALHTDLCEALYYQGALAEAAAACDRALALDSANTQAQIHRAWIAMAAPDGRAEAERALLGLHDYNHVHVATGLARVHARLGQRDSALAHIEQAVAGRMFLAPFLIPDPLFDFLRDDPDWIAAVRRMGLE